MLFEGFSEPARDVVVRAKAIAKSRGDDFVGTEHLLLSLIRQRGSVAAEALQRHGIDLDLVTDAIVSRYVTNRQIGYTDPVPSSGDLFSAQAKRALYLARLEAHSLGCNTIDTEHLLLGLISETCMATELLMYPWCNLDKLRRTITKILLER